MVRLGVHGDEKVQHALAGRLAGATVSAVALTGDVLPDGCDAVLWLDPHPGDAGSIQRLLGGGKHVMLTAQSWLSGTALDSLATAARGSGARLMVENPERYL